jgi:hypothetical protein
VHRCVDRQRRRRREDREERVLDWLDRSADAAYDMRVQRIFGANGKRNGSDTPEGLEKPQ